MKKTLLFVLVSMFYTLNSNAGALRIPDGQGETHDYAVTAASLKNGSVSLEARKYKVSVNGSLEEVERKYFKIENDVLKTTGTEATGLISLVLNQNIRGDVVCTVIDFVAKKSDPEMNCSTLVINAGLKN